MLTPIQYALIAAGAVLLCILIVSDHRSNHLANKHTLALLSLGLCVNTKTGFAFLHDALLGMAIGYIAIRSLHDLQILFRGFAGIGLGDAKMLGALGAWFGWQNLPVFLVGGSLITLAVYPVREQKPFGVGLALMTFGMLGIHLMAT